MDDYQIDEWVGLVMKNEEIVNHTIHIQEETNKGDGYLSNIAFVTVTGDRKSGTKKEYNLVIKSSDARNKLRNQFPIDQYFKNEIHAYDDVKPAFETLQQQKGVSDLLEFLPHCYDTKIADTGEMLILENVKPKGYDLWDRKVPMTSDHIKLILETYGKWHAFSLVLKKENPGEFAKLTKKNKNMFGYIRKLNMADVLVECYEKAKNGAALPQEIETLNELQFSEDEVKHIFSDLYEEDPLHRVILHGDCWTNNFMFKYQDDIKKPSSLCIIDWQCSGYASPVMDLSYFFYTCCDTEKYQDVEELLKIYYNSLSETLKLLGHNEDLFSYNDLKKHWTKFSCYGLLACPFILKFSLCDETDAPDLGKTAEEGKAIIDAFRFDLNDPRLYFKRVRDNILHYLKNLKLNVT